MVKNYEIVLTVTTARVDMTTKDTTTRRAKDGSTRARIRGECYLIFAFGNSN